MRCSFHFSGPDQTIRVVIKSWEKGGSTWETHHGVTFCAWFDKSIIGSRIHSKPERHGISLGDHKTGYILDLFHTSQRYCLGMKWSQARYM